MKTAMIMKRELMGSLVRQNHKTEMLNANDLHLIGNEIRSRCGMKQKQMGSYFALGSTKELIRELCIIDCLDENEVKATSRGKNGGTWLHPVLFIDMAMWYSPELKVKIIKWVCDGLLMARDNSGESFKRMNSALNEAFPDEMENPKRYIDISNRIAMACGVGAGRDRWQSASESQLKLRDKIQETAAIIADMSGNVGECINMAIKKSLI